MPSVCSAFYGFKKPWKHALVLTVLLLPVSSILYRHVGWPAVLIALLVGPMYYFLNKSLTVGIVENSSWTGGFAFKRSVIEGKSIS